MTPLFLLLFVLAAASRPISAGRLVNKNDLQLEEEFENFGLVGRFASSASEALTEAVQLIGRVVPLRGLASVAADIGLPGAKFLLGVLDDRDDVLLENRVDLNVEDNDSPLKEEMSSLVGAYHGQQRCMERLACLAGKRLLGVNGAASSTVVVAAAVSSYVPDRMRAGYEAFKDAQLYSGRCDVYKCETI